MVQLSNAAIRMSTVDRTKQELNWYDGGIYLCTNAFRSFRIAAQIEAECKRRNIKYKSFSVKELSMARGDVSNGVVMSDYNIYKIGIHRSWETTALEKKQLADWAVTTFNNKEGPLCPHDPISYNVWIQPSSDVMNPITMTEAEYDLGLETHWV